MKRWNQTGWLAGIVLSVAGITMAVTPEEIAQMEKAMPAKATAAPKKPHKMLVFSLCYGKGFKHSCIPYWEKSLEIMGKKTGAFTIDVSVDMNVFTAENLKKYDAICFNNSTALEPTPEQAKAIVDFINNGNAIIGIHAGADSFYKNPEIQEIIGNKFSGHPWTDGAGEWAYKIDDPTHPLMKAFGGKGFRAKDEIYRTEPPLYSRSKMRVLMSLDMNDEVNKKPKDLKPSDADTGLSWIKNVGKGRLFYGSLGHNIGMTWNPMLLQHYLDGIQWAMGDIQADATPIPAPKAATGDAKTTGTSK
jgi:type 1 glutamine amidotransferase